MEMAVHIAGGGLRLPIEGFSLSLSMGCYIAFRGSKNQQPFEIKMQDWMSLGNRSGTFIVSLVETGWFELGPENEAKLPPIDSLLGNTLELSVKTSLLARGTVDIELKRLSDYGYPQILINSYGRKAKGFQFGDSVIRGKAIRSVLNEPAYADIT